MPATIAITVSIPTSDKKAQEVMWISRALELAQQDIRSGGGLKTSGTINADGVNPLVTWVYVPQASS
jgi:hypothetical protein